MSPFDIVQPESLVFKSTINKNIASLGPNASLDTTSSNPYLQFTLYIDVKRQHILQLHKITVITTIDILVNI
jgi:hypothetical protein